MLEVTKFLRKRWNIFQDAPQDLGYRAGPMTMARPNRMAGRPSFGMKTLKNSIYNHMAVDVGMTTFYHAKVDGEGNPVEEVSSQLNELLRLNTNIDQTAMAFFIDLALTMMENGVAAVAPIDSMSDTNIGIVKDPGSLRVARIVAWYPRHVGLEVYDDRDVDEAGNPVAGGVVKQVTLPKSQVAIIENPFYNIMNEPNSVGQRLIRKLDLLDAADEAAGSGKLDLILQLPYTVRGDKRKVEAKNRRDALSEQLQNDPLGIGYVDVSEKVIQLNRMVDNKLIQQIDDLQKRFMDDLGITPEVMNGSASTTQVNMYLDRTIEPIITAIVQEFRRKFLTKTARTQGHSIEVYRDPLRLIPIEELAEVADKLMRNAVVTANELRPKIGFRPSSDARANELANPNMPVMDQPGEREKSNDEPSGELPEDPPE